MPTKRGNMWNGKLIGVLVIILLVGAIPLVYFGAYNVFVLRENSIFYQTDNVPTGGGEETGIPYYGPITFKSDCQFVYNLSTAASGVEPTVKMWDATKTSSLAVTTDGSTATTFTLRSEDKGKAFLTADYGTGTSIFLYMPSVKEYSRNFITGWEPWDYDKDGILEYSFAMDFASLPALIAGESSKTVQFNLPIVKAETSQTITSQNNATSISTSAYEDKYATGYISITSGNALKLVRMRLVYGSTADNDTYVDNGNFKLVEVTMGWPSSYGGPKTYSGALITNDDSNDRYNFDLGVTDLNNEYYAGLIYRDRNVGDTAITFSIHALCKFPSASKTEYMYLELTTIDPASTMDSTTLVQYVQFAS
jgi:hypothetical protein